MCATVFELLCFSDFVGFDAALVRRQDVRTVMPTDGWFVFPMITDFTNGPPGKDAAGRYPVDEEGGRGRNPAALLHLRKVGVKRFAERRGTIILHGGIPGKHVV